MGKKKKPKWKYKFVSVDKYEEFKKLPADKLTELVLRFDTNFRAESANKKSNSEIKSLGKEIKAHRDSYTNADEKFENAKIEYEAERQARDAAITELIEDKKALESGYRTSIDGFKEHRDVCLALLKEKKNRE